MITNAMPSTRTPQAAQELERFMGSYHAYLHWVNTFPLTILVWGPGKNQQGEIVEKRVQIKYALINQHHNAFFSEDIPMPDPTISLSTHEFGQAQAAHLIVILLESSPGALGEVHEFCWYPEIVGKVLVLAPKRYKDGFAAHGVLKVLEDGYGGVYWYEPNEIKNCQVLGRALLRAQARREIYARSISGRR